MHRKPHHSRFQDIDELFESPSFRQIVILLNNASIPKEVMSAFEKYLLAYEELIYTATTGRTREELEASREEFDRVFESYKNAYFGGKIKLRAPFGNYLKQIMEVKGVDFATLADKTGLSKSYLSELINCVADNPSMNTLSKLGSALDGKFIITPEGLKFAYKKGESS